MMKSPIKSVLAVRSPSGEIVTEEMKEFSIRKKFKLFRLPDNKRYFRFYRELGSRI